MAAIFFTEGDIHDADFVVTSSTNGTKKRLSTWNPIADPMLFLLLFPSGDVGYDWNNLYRSPLRGERANVSMAEFYMYRLAHQEGQIQFGCGGKLFQQYIVMAYIKVEDGSLTGSRRIGGTYVPSLTRVCKTMIRSVQAGDMRVGKIIVLPSMFRESPCFRYQKYMDSLAGMRVFGSYDLFVMFTCNPRWPEIADNLKRGQHHTDRVDLACRVVKAKLDFFIEDLLQAKPFWYNCVLDICY